MRWLGRLMLRIPPVRRAVRDRSPRGRFRPDRRFRWGVYLVAAGLITGWPLVALLGGVALYAGSSDIVLVGGPLCYAGSWVIYAGGFLLAGMAARRYVLDTGRWGLRRITEALLGGREAALLALPPAAPPAPLDAVPAPLDAVPAPALETNEPTNAAASAPRASGSGADHPAREDAHQ
jgi:hypothetical protein